MYAPGVDELSPALYRAGRGPQLVLLHGFTGTWGHWRPVLADLASGHEVIAPTITGHYGAPPHPAGTPMTMPGAAEELERRLDELGVQQAHFVGNSMGGALALEMAKRGRALSVVAIAPGGVWEHGSSEPARLADYFERSLRISRAADRYAPLLMRGALRRRLALRDVMRRGDLMRPEEAVEMTMAAVRCEVSDAVIAALRADAGVTLTDLDRIACPVLLVTPSHDRILPPALHAPRPRREIPGVVSRSLPAGHVPMWDTPQLVVQMVTDFVAANTPVAAAA